MEMMTSYLGFLMLDRSIDLLFAGLESCLLPIGWKRVRLIDLELPVPCMWVKWVNGLVIYGECRCYPPPIVYVASEVSEYPPWGLL